jgi:hypothetical protein
MVAILPLNVSQAGTTWIIETVDSTGNTGLYCSLALDSNDNPHISYYDLTTEDLKYIRSINGVWSTPVTVDSAGDVGRYCSLALDSAGNPHISYYDATNGDLKYVTKTEGAWNTPQTVDWLGDVGLYCSLALDSADNPHISYYDKTNNDLRFIYGPNSEWFKVRWDSDEDDGQYSSLALDSYDNPHISYYDASHGDLKYVRMSFSGVWLAPVIVDSAGDVGRVSSLALDSTRSPHIIYEDWTNGDLKYVTKSGGPWNAPVTVNLAGDTGIYPSLTLDSNDNPHISYYDLTTEDLKYIRSINGVWSTPVTVDSIGVSTILEGNSLALDSNDNPHISYLDYTNEDLKYARLETVSGLSLEGANTWYWNGYTTISSVAGGDVDGDGQMEIVTGGYFDDGFCFVAQLCVWDGATLALENVKTWYWTFNTFINSVAVGDVDGDGKQEIVTGGSHWDGTRGVSQLCVWNGETLALENVETWYWVSTTIINSVAVGDVDGDGKQEVVTGGYFDDDTRFVAQLCVWDGATLALENVETWYWTSDTRIVSISIGDVDGDSMMEIVTGGYFDDGTRTVAQLGVWDGSSLALEGVKVWCWNSYTRIRSVAVGDVDADGQVEIVTGGDYAGGGYNAQLCVWDGSSLGLEKVQAWQWTGDTLVSSVGVGDVDGDGQVEVVTGGYHWAGYAYAQLCVWDGASLMYECGSTWNWGQGTLIYSIAVGNVGGDAKPEIVTGGEIWTSPRTAQLCVWSIS